MQCSPGCSRVENDYSDGYDHQILETLVDELNYKGGKDDGRKDDGRAII